MKIIQQQGFTLIELLVTIAVMAILASMAAPSFGDMRVKQNLNRSVQELITTLNSARSQSVIERREVAISLSAAENNSLPTNTMTTLYWMPYGKSTLSGGAKTVSFNINGGIKDATIDTSFKICSKGVGSTAKTVTVAMTGTIQMITEGTC